MVIVETPTFTRMIKDLLDEDSYRLLQIELAENPEKGAIIRGTGVSENCVGQDLEEGNAAVPA